MRFTKSFALLAVLALCLTPFKSYADPKSAPVEAYPNLTVQSGDLAPDADLQILNTGLAAAGQFHVTIKINSASYSITVPGLAAGAALPIHLSDKSSSITVTVDDLDVVPESNEDDNKVTLHVIS
jgi:subtilase family serine protease